MSFDLLDDLFDRDGREQRGRRSGIGGLLDRILGGDRDRLSDDDRHDDERARYRRSDDGDDRSERRERDRRVYDRDDDDWEYERRRRRERDNDLFDFD
jgi:hypothetical protein